MTEPLGTMVGRVLRDAPFAMRQLAADSGLSYDVLRSWRSGRRRPSRASAKRLADGLERRGQRLLELAQELRANADGEEDRREGTGPARQDTAAAEPDIRASEAGALREVS